MSKLTKTLFLILSIFLSIQNAAAGTKCPTGQVPNYMIKGKCITKAAQKLGLAEFTKNACIECHSASGSACPNDFGAGSCSYKKMAQLIKSTNDGAGNKKSVSPDAFLTLYNAYLPYMNGAATPTTGQIKKYINYLATIKQ